MSDAWEIIQLASLSRLTMQAHLMGSALHHASQAEDDEAVAALRQIAGHATFVWSPYTGQAMRRAIDGEFDSHGRIVIDGTRLMITQYARRALRYELAQTAGDWRLLAAALALLNARTSVTKTKAVPKGGTSGRATYRGKPFLDHHVISLIVPRDRVTPIFTDTFSYASPKKRRHQVEGHWCHSRTPGKTLGDPACVHVYDEPGASSQTCLLCGHKKWWRRAHERGDAGIGYVTQDRAVTSRTPVS